MKHYIGIDQHKQFSQVAVMQENGRLTNQAKLYHSDKEGMKEFFSSFNGRISATIEATSNWYWLYEMLEELKVEVKLAHPLKTRAIAEARIKTDKLDAKTLAHLDRADLVVQSYLAPPQVRDLRSQLRYRLSLVKMCIATKLRIHALLSQQGITPPTFRDLFGREGTKYLKTLQMREACKRAINGYLELIEKLNELIKTVTHELKRYLKEDKRAPLIMSIPGVGYLTAYLLLAEIGDIKRFLSQNKLCSYAGLVPSTYQSANTCYHGRITKQGNKYIRWAMVEASHTAVKNDLSLNLFYNRIAKKKGKSKATVAVARKLLIAVYQVLKREQPYKANSLTRIHLGKPVHFTGHHE